jgi:hypothetical protein
MKYTENQKNHVSAFRQALRAGLRRFCPWSMPFNSKTHEVSCWQGNDVHCLMKFLMLIVCVTVIMILMLFFCFDSGWNWVLRST